MATRVGCGRIFVTSLNSPTPKRVAWKCRTWKCRTGATQHNTQAVHAEIRI